MLQFKVLEASASGKHRSAMSLSFCFLSKFKVAVSVLWWIQKVIDFQISQLFLFENQSDDFQILYMSQLKLKFYEIFCTKIFQNYFQDIFWLFKIIDSICVPELKNQINEWQITTSRFLNVGIGICRQARGWY